MILGYINIFPFIDLIFCFVKVDFKFLKKLLDLKNRLSKLGSPSVDTIKSPFIEFDVLSISLVATTVLKVKLIGSVFKVKAAVKSFCVEAGTSNLLLL